MTEKLPRVPKNLLYHLFFSVFPKNPPSSIVENYSSNAYIVTIIPQCTESYLTIGVDLGLNEVSSNNLIKFLSTKFARFLHSVGKASQDATSKTFKFVPLQDFTSNSDIDWSKSIPEIDQQLYSKYGLDDNEKAFIEKMIKPME